MTMTNEELEAENEQLRQQINIWESREGAVCPEDRSFEEVIAALRQRVQALEEAGNKLADCAESVRFDNFYRDVINLLDAVDTWRQAALEDSDE